MSFNHTMLAKKCLLLAKIEGDYGTDPAPVKTANVMLAYDVVITPTREVEPRPEQVSTFGKLGTAVGKQSVDFSFKISSLGGIIGVGKEPPESPLLQMCNMKEIAATAGTGAIYNPETAIGKSTTLWFYNDGIVYKINGCKGNVILRAVSGRLLELEFAGKGLYKAGASLAFVSDPTIPSGLPIVCKSLLMEIGGTMAGVETFEINLNNEITESADVSTTSGVRSVNIVGRSPAITANPEATTTLITTQESAIDTPTSQIISVNLASGTYGIQLIVAKAWLTAATKGERNGKVIMDLAFLAGQDAATDDEIMLQYNKA